MVLTAIASQSADKRKRGKRSYKKSLNYMYAFYVYNWKLSRTRNNFGGRNLCTIARTNTKNNRHQQTNTVKENEVKQLPERNKNERTTH